jgi:hypothetical protein
MLSSKILNILSSKKRQPREIISSRSSLPELGVADLQEFLQVPVLRAGLMRYAQKEFQDDMILFYEDVQEYKKATNHDRKNKAERLFKLYFSVDTEFVVSVSEEMRENVRNKLDENVVDERLFDEIEAYLLNELKDVYGRYSAICSLCNSL